MRMSLIWGSSSMLSYCQNSTRLMPSVPYREQPAMYRPSFPRRSGRCHMHQVGGTEGSSGSALNRLGNGTISGSLQVFPPSSEYLPNISPQRCFFTVVSWFHRQYRRPLLLIMGCCHAATGAGLSKEGEPAIITGSVQVLPPSALLAWTTFSLSAASKDPWVQKAWSSPRPLSSRT